MERLECPACHGALRWRFGDRRGDRLEEAEAACVECGSTYPVQEGIGLFLTPDLPRHDLWEESESGIAAFLRGHPEIEDKLMNSPIESLSPADQFFRASILADRGDFATAGEVSRLAYPRLYTSEHHAAYKSQIDFVVDRLAGEDGPAVDLASGTCGLVEEMARRLTRPIVATDFSPRVLRRDRRRFDSLGLGDRVSFLAFDARRTPFKDGAVATMTTNQGLPNIEQPGTLLKELRRAISGTFLAVTSFCPEDDPVNGPLLRRHGLETFFFKRLALEAFAAAGWRVEAANGRLAPARPTPTSELVPGAAIDGFPAADTILEWCVLMAR